MKSAGVIITYIIWTNWKELPFNLCLFVYQMVLMVVGTAYGKFEWKIEKPIYVDYILAPVCLFGIVAYVVGITDGLLGGVIVLTLLFFVSATLLTILTAIIRGIPWPLIWRAAQASHVRLVLEEPNSNHVLDYLVANFGHPRMEIQLWREKYNDGKRFKYYDPTFEPSPEFIAAMIEYAEKQVGKRYDTLQLFSFGLNFIFWLWPPWWGKEKLKWLNLRGAREVCSSGIAANLRWADKQAFPKTVYDMNEKDVMWVAWIFTSPECRYDTAMVSPCLFAIDNNWEKI